MQWKRVCERVVTAYRTYLLALSKSDDEKCLSTWQLRANYTDNR